MDDETKELTVDLYYIELYSKHLQQRLEQNTIDKSDAPIAQHKLAGKVLGAVNIKAGPW